MNDKGQELCKKAEEYVKKNGAIIKEKFANPEIYLSSENPVSIFMAGSPGAGKTEVSRRLIENFKSPVVRIDADEIRNLFDGYTGDNAYIFQSACTMAVSNLFGHCLKRNINFILDATFSYNGSLENIKKSLSKGRKVEIYFIFQEPIKAWFLTQEREKTENRRVTKRMFIDSFIGAIENVNKAKEVFGRDIDLNLIIKDYDSGFEQSEFKIEKLDGYLPKAYIRSQLEEEII